MNKILSTIILLLFIGIMIAAEFSNSCPVSYELNGGGVVGISFAVMFGFCAIILAIENFFED